MHVQCVCMCMCVYVVNKEFSTYHMSVCVCGNVLV